MITWARAVSLMGVLVGAWAWAVTAFGSDDIHTYLTEADGRKTLKEPLTLREEQGGIVGLTGTVWTVEPSGAWRVAKFKPGKGGKEETTVQRSGQLTPEQLTELAKELTERNLTGLPEKTGREAKVNPHRVTVKFGRKQWTLSGLGPRRSQGLKETILKGAPAKAAPESSVWTRFAHIAHVIEERCKPAE